MMSPRAHSSSPISLLSQRSGGIEGAPPGRKLSTNARSTVSHAASSASPSDFPSGLCITLLLSQAEYGQARLRRVSAARPRKRSLILRPDLGLSRGARTTLVCVCNQLSRVVDFDKSGTYVRPWTRSWTSRISPERATGGTIPMTWAPSLPTQWSKGAKRRLSPAISPPIPGAVALYDAIATSDESPPTEWRYLQWRF